MLSSTASASSQHTSEERLFPSRKLKWDIIKLWFPILSFAVLVLLGICAYVAERSTEQLASRNAQLQSMLLRRDIESSLQDMYTALVRVAPDAQDQFAMTRYLQRYAKEKPESVHEVAFIGTNPNEHYALLIHQGKVTPLPFSVFQESAAPLLEREHLTTTQTAMPQSSPVHVTYPTLSIDNTKQALSLYTLRRALPVKNPQGDVRGILIFATDIQALRNHLSLSTPPNAEAGNTAPLPSFFFDTKGWILFQSEAPADIIPALSTDTVRAGLKGDSGRSDFPIAFRPSAMYEQYWKMLDDILQGKQGSLRLTDDTLGGENNASATSLAFEPVFFQGNGAQPLLIGGIAVLDTNSSGTLIWYLYAFCALILLALLGTCLYQLGSRLALRLSTITELLHAQNTHKRDAPLHLWPQPQEFTDLCTEINTLFARLQRAALLVRKCRNIHAAQQRREVATHLPETVASPPLGLAGKSQAVRDLRQQILEAASLPNDLLILGETGSGKDTVARAIHKSSSNAQSPYLSINCASLDENLLLDTLFGHVKSSVTEAQQDRTGAFYSVGKGTLVLDAIDKATPKVQHIIANALMTRSIRPLGSDQDIPYHARIIAVANDSLPQEVAQQHFHEALYSHFSSATISIPPLRSYKEDIPLLASYFLSQTLRDPQQRGSLITNGALEKLLHFDWPGNVRQLKNTLVQAASNSADQRIYAEDIAPEAPETMRKYAAPVKLYERENRKPLFVHESPNKDTVACSPFSWDIPPRPTLEESKPAPVAVATPPQPAVPQPTQQPPEPKPIQPEPKPTPPVTVKKAPVQASLTPQSGETMDAILHGLEMNRRQKMLAGLLHERKTITRQEYQELIQEGISDRTAQYDLQLFVTHGILRKEGKGPAQKYFLNVPL